MESMDYTRFCLALAGVIGLIWALASVLKYFGLDKKLRGASGQAGRLSIVDVVYLDPKRKLVLARADAREYVLLVSGDNVTLLDTLPKDQA